MHRSTIFAFLAALLGACATTTAADSDSATSGPAERQSRAAGFVFSELEASNEPCGALPPNTQDLRTACEDFGGTLSSSEDETRGYALRCDWADGSAQLTLAPHARSGHFDVTAPGCANHFGFDVVAVSGPVF